MYAFRLFGFRIMRPNSRRLDRPFLVHEQVDAKHVNQILTGIFPRVMFILIHRDGDPRLDTGVNHLLPALLILELRSTILDHCMPDIQDLNR